VKDLNVIPEALKLLREITSKYRILIAQEIITRIAHWITLNKKNLLHRKENNYQSRNIA
jgi:hypothetical protein